MAVELEGTRAPLVSSHPNGSFRSPPNFVSRLLLLSEKVLFRERNERNGLQAGYLPIMLVLAVLQAFSLGFGFPFSSKSDISEFQFNLDRN